MGDTVRNPSVLASGASRTRYYLSLDPLKSADRVFSAVRNVPGLAPGASHAGTAILRVPTAAPPPPAR